MTSSLGCIFLCFIKNKKQRIECQIRIRIRSSLAHHHFTPCSLIVLREKLRGDFIMKRTIKKHKCPARKTDLIYESCKEVKPVPVHDIERSQVKTLLKILLKKKRSKKLITTIALHSRKIVFPLHLYLCLERPVLHFKSTTSNASVMKMTLGWPWSSSRGCEWRSFILYSQDKSWRDNLLR